MMIEHVTFSIVLAQLSCSVFADFRQPGVFDVVLDVGSDARVVVECVALLHHHHLSLGGFRLFSVVLFAVRVVGVVFGC